MSDITDTIGALIETHLKIWHQAIRIKKDGKPDRSLPTKERVAIFYKIRKLNALRSELRWNIDDAFGGGTNETKVNYHRG